MNISTQLYVLNIISLTSRLNSLCFKLSKCLFHTYIKDKNKRQLSRNSQLCSVYYRMLQQIKHPISNLSIDDI